MTLIKKRDGALIATVTQTPKESAPKNIKKENYFDPPSDIDRRQDVFGKGLAVLKVSDALQKQCRVLKPLKNDKTKQNENLA